MLNCTGWKIGWMVGPSHLVKQAMYVHEACSFNTNVPGQIALAKSLDDAYNLEYEGEANYFDYTKNSFEKAREEVLGILKESKEIKFKP